MIRKTPVAITSVDPTEGCEGTIVTLKGTGFAKHIRNNCVVVGGMGACARPETEASDTELKIKIGPVPEVTQGDILMWPGVGLDLHTEEVAFGRSKLSFSEIAVFRNGAPQTSAGIQFKLTKESPNTFAGRYQDSAIGIELGGFEGGAMRVSFPRDCGISRFQSMDACIVLKEPTLAIDFSADISTVDDEECLRTVAKTITINAALIGEKVFSTVVADSKTGTLELFVTKPYLQKGMVALRFA